MEKPARTQFPVHDVVARRWSPPATMQLSRMVASRSGESTIAAEVLMNNVG